MFTSSTSFAAHSKLAGPIFSTKYLDINHIGTSSFLTERKNKKHANTVINKGFFKTFENAEKPNKDRKNSDICLIS